VTHSLVTWLLQPIRYLQPLIGPQKAVSNIPLETGTDHARCDPTRPGKTPIERPICSNRTPNSEGAGGPGNPRRCGFQRKLTHVHQVLVVVSILHRPINLDRVQDDSLPVGGLRFTERSRSGRVMTLAVPD